MLKKSLILTLLLPLSIAYAETCPTLHELKTDIFISKGWQALNINSGEPLSPAEWKRVKPHIKEFAMAQWVADAPEGTAQCYYKEAYAEMELDVYFAKNTFAPDKKSGNWHTVSYNTIQCDINLSDCRYEDHA